MNLNPEILVIDDVPGAADDFASLISAKYNFKVVTATNPEESIKQIKLHPIKVVVLDQKMPLMSGTQLYQELKVINPLIRTIMLSGEADTEEVSRALTSGFEDFLPKSNISKLPEKVYEAYIQFEINFANQLKVNDYPILLSEKASFFSQHAINFHIFNIEKLNDEFIFQDKWTNILDIHAGQSISFEEKLIFEESVTVNEDFEYKLKTDFNLSNKQIDILKLNINGEINRRLSLSTNKKRISEKSKTNTFSLPEQPTDLSVNYIAKRVFEHTPVYMEFRGLICKACSFCRHYQHMPIIFYKQTNKIASRQINFMKNQDKEIINTGISQYF